jgi:hypothetical protein
LKRTNTNDSKFTCRAAKNFGILLPPFNDY